VRRVHRNDDGAAAVEFALLLPLLMLFLFGIIQYGYGLFQLQAFSAAVGDAGRSAATGITDCRLFSTAVTSLVSGNGLDPDDVSGIKVQWLTDQGVPTNAPNPLGRVQVTASFTPFKIGLPFVPFPDRITRTTTATIQNVGLASLVGCG
jgi:Flp pilus assembly protein TadG